MTDSKTQGIETSSGDEPVEIEEQREESIPEEQIGDRFSGNELENSDEQAGESVPEERHEQAFRGSMEESDEKEPESIPEKDRAGFSDIHLDKLEEFNELREKKRQLFQKDTPPETKTEVLIGTKWLSLLIALVLCLLAGTGYFLMKAGKSPIDPTQQEEESPKPDRSTRSEDQDLLFDSFVIPLKQNEQFTYISLSISFKLPNISLKREMIEKKDQLRGIIYNILEDEINRTKEIPSLEALKAFITRGANKALVHGKVQEVFITQFLAV